MKNVKKEVEEAQVVDAPQSLTTLEFEKLKTLNQQFMNLTMDIGNNEVQRMSVEQRRQQLESAFKESQVESDEFTNGLREKYGDININISTGEFVKATPQS